jgi:PAS domain S-box-containing protein
MDEPLKARQENQRPGSSAEPSPTQAEPAAPLESILLTEQLRERPRRSPDYETENRALALLVQALADSPRTILQTLADKVVELLRAGSAGLSLLTKDGARFYWAAVAGEWSPHLGGGTPRDFGPCGDVLDCSKPLLFTHWERRYPYLVSATPLAEEGLLVPFEVEGKQVGTIWAISHDPHRVFDSEDLRLLESLGRFASAAYQAVESRGALDRGRVALARVIASAMDAIITFDSTRRIELFNEAAEEVFGLPAGRAIGASIDLILTDGFRLALDQSMRAFAGGGMARPYVWAPDGLTAKRSDGSEFPIEATVSHFEAGDRNLFTLILRDVDDRRRAEAELRELGSQNEYLQQERTRLETQNAYLIDEIRSEQNFGDIIGGSPGLHKVMQRIKLVAPTEATVLITGESGTGKELVARAIHEHSTRKSRPLIKLNCSAVPEGLFESEFFGHVKGAFTGALKDKPGRFELADGGTVFLDEIGEVPLAMQAKLLRVLQEQELERVGDTRTRKVNVRVMAASNRDLKKESDEGRFRVDLFYRLSVFPIEVPPLRERREDIRPLVAHFIRQSARRMNRPEPQISKTALDRLAAYQWPGNVRELQNAVERAIILWREGPLTFDLPALPANPNTNGSVKSAGKAALLTRDELKHEEREAIINALKQTNGKVSGPGGAAELLGMKPSTLSSRISSLGIDRRTLS